MARPRRASPVASESIMASRRSRNAEKDTEVSYTQVNTILAHVNDRKSRKKTKPAGM